MSSQGQDANSEDDPYTQRSFSEYYDSDNESNSSSSRQSTQSSTSNATSTTSTSHSNNNNNKSPPRPSLYLDSRNSRDPGYVIDEDEEDETDEIWLQNGNAQRTEEEEPLLGTNPGNQDSRNSTNEKQPEGEENEEEDKEVYYALLNVAKDASEDEIRDAYRTLAVALHPDKHTSPDLKSAAENRFREIQKAYEVLSDAEKRSIYDHFGPQGLNRSWSLVRRSNAGGPRTAAEMREEWERIARQKKAEELENRVRSKSEFTANLDASSLFCSADRVPRSKDVLRKLGQDIARIEEETGKKFDPNEAHGLRVPDVSFFERWNRVGFTSLVGKHGWETPLTMYSRLLINGQMASKAGMGGGNVNGTLRTQWNSKLSTEASIALLPPRVASLKSQYELTKFTFLNFTATGSTFALPPALQLSVAQRVSQKSNMTGFTVFNTGTYTLGFWGKDVRIRNGQTPNISFGMSDRLGEGKGWTWQAGLGLENQSVSLDYAYRPSIFGSPKFRAGITLGTQSGLNAFHSMERKVTEHVRLGMGVYFGIPLGGVTLQLRFNRLGQKLVVPIQLSPEYRPDLVAGCALLPGVGLLAAEHLYFRPRRRANVQNRLINLRKQHKDLIVRRKEAAQEAITVLRENAKKRAQSEFSSAGLVVISAYYGKKNTWPDRQDDGKTPEELYRATWTETGNVEAPNEQQEVELDWWDVTIPVMMLVHRSQLVIPGERQKHKLLGFFDPCMGERKHLIVRYLFRNRLHEVIVDDITQLTAPLRVHQL